MKRFLLIFSCVTVGVSLISCGFTPMYGTESNHSKNVSMNLSQVKITNIPDREGQFLRNELIDQFYKDGRPEGSKYILDVTPILERITNLDITRSSDVTRSQLMLSTSMTLRDAQSGEVLLQRNMSATSSFNVLEGEFATRFSEQNTRENALRDIARQIELQLGLYFNR